VYDDGTVGELFISSFARKDVAARRVLGVGDHAVDRPAHYLARVRGPESAELRRGWVVDAAIEAHFKALLATGEALPQHDIQDIYAAAWQRRIDDAAVEIDWGDDTPAHVKDTGLIALRAYLAELAPTVRPTSVQREFAFALAPSSSGH
jgi:transposase